MGDEVITTSMTAEPTNTVILQCGAEPGFADVGSETGNLDPDSVAAAIVPKTKAIMVVHYAGFPVDMPAMRRIAAQHGVALIEDAAHALGARCAGSPIGTIGDFGIFALQAIKYLTTIDGGVLTIRNQLVDAGLNHL